MLNLTTNLYKKKLIIVVIVNTNVTAIPNPVAVSISLLTAMNEHIPKKLEKIIFEVKIDAKNITKGLIVIT